MKNKLFIVGLLSAFPVFADIVIYPTGIVSTTCDSTPGCPGGYCGYATYVKSVSAGWGWKPDTNNFTVFSATDTNRNNTKIQYFGKSGDNNCNVTSVNVPNPPLSVAYRFTVFFTNNVPTGTNYPLTLHGFNP